MIEDYEKQIISTSFLTDFTDRLKKICHDNIKIYRRHNIKVIYKNCKCHKITQYKRVNGKNQYATIKVFWTQTHNRGKQDN